MMRAQIQLRIGMGVVLGAGILLCGGLAMVVMQQANASPPRSLPASASELDLWESRLARMERETWKPDENQAGEIAAVREKIAGLRRMRKPGGG